MTDPSRLENAIAVELIPIMAMLTRPLPLIRGDTSTRSGCYSRTAPDVPTLAGPIGGALFQVMADSLHVVSATGLTAYPAVDDEVANTFSVRPVIVPGTELRSNFR